jgi:hypothetical protein
MNKEVCRKCIEKNICRRDDHNFEENWMKGFVYCPTKYRNGYDIRVAIDIETMPFWCPNKRDHEQESGDAKK